MQALAVVTCCTFSASGLGWLWQGGETFHFLSMSHLPPPPDPWDGDLKLCKGLAERGQGAAGPAWTGEVSSLAASWLTQQQPPARFSSPFRVPRCLKRGLIGLWPSLLQAPQAPQPIGSSQDPPSPLPTTVLGSCLHTSILPPPPPPTPALDGPQDPLDISWTSLAPGPLACAAQATLVLQSEWHL